MRQHRIVRRTAVMENDDSPLNAEKAGELSVAGKRRSPCSARSSPFPSSISENELDIPSLSRHSSCSSLNQRTIPSSLSLSSQNHISKLFESRASVNQEKMHSDTERNLERISAGKMRESIREEDSDEDTMDDDSNCSSNDASNSSCGGNHCGGRRSNCGSSDVTWRSPNDGSMILSETGRKPSLLTTSYRAATPSPSGSGRSSPVTCVVRAPSRSRVANIRRESNCSVESEAAHEKLVKTAQQVSVGFDEFCIAEGERKRTHSLSEPISILTNAFLPHSCSPSPTRAVDIQKQCYSPSTQQIVRNNITYSPSPSPTPSPTRRIMRSLSPIAVRQLKKRRYTGSTGVDSDGEAPSPGLTAPKRVCPPVTVFANGSVLSLSSDRASVYAFPPTETSASCFDRLGSGPFCSPFPPYKMLLDPAIERQRFPPLVSPMDSDDGNSTVGDEESPAQEASTSAASSSTSPLSSSIIQDVKQSKSEISVQPEGSRSVKDGETATKNQAHEAEMLPATSAL